MFVPKVLIHWGQDKMAAIFQTTFLNENVWIFTKISLKFVPRVPINNIPGLVQIMVWHSGAKPLSEPMMVNILTNIYAQWVNCLYVNDGVMDHQLHLFSWYISTTIGERYWTHEDIATAKCIQKSWNEMSASTHHYNIIPNYLQLLVLKCWALNSFIRSFILHSRHSC